MLGQALTAVSTNIHLRSLRWVKWQHARPREKVRASLVEGYDPLALPAPQEFTCEILRVPSTYFSPVILTA